MEFINRAYQFEVRAKEDESKHTIYGLPIVFDSRTDIGGMFAEVIEKGALDNTDLKDVRFLVNHDLNKIPLARSRNNNENSTLRLKKTDKGLEIEADIDVENNADARALYSAIERGDISGMSFMFGVDDEEWEGLDTDYPTRHIRGISQVVEVSAVTFPAYEATTISARDKNALDSARSALDSARSSLESEKLELEKLKIKYLYD